MRPTSRAFVSRNAVTPRGRIEIVLRFITLRFG
jgi:hypothetical protein